MADRKISELDDTSVQSGDTTVVVRSGQNYEATLGGAAARETGVVQGQIPLVGAGNKLPASVIPASDPAGTGLPQATIDKINRYPENPQAIRSAWIGPYKLLSEYNNVAYGLQHFQNIEVPGKAFMVAPQSGGQVQIIINLEPEDSDAATYLLSANTKGQRLRIYQGVVQKVTGIIHSVVHLNDMKYRIVLSGPPITANIVANALHTFEIGSQHSFIERYPPNPQDIQPAKLGHYRSNTDLNYRTVAYNGVAYNLNNLALGRIMWSNANSANTRLVKIRLTDADTDLLVPKLTPGAKFSLVQVSDNLPKWAGVVLDAQLREKSGEHHVIEITLDAARPLTQNTVGTASIAMYLQVEGEWTQQIRDLIPGANAGTRDEIIAGRSSIIKAWSPQILHEGIEVLAPRIGYALNPPTIDKAISAATDYKMDVHIPVNLAGVSRVNARISNISRKRVAGNAYLDYKSGTTLYSFVFEVTPSTKAEIPANGGFTFAEIDLEDNAGNVLSRTIVPIPVQAAPSGGAPRLVEVFSFNSELSDSWVATTFNIVAGKVYYVEIREPESHRAATEASEDYDFIQRVVRSDTLLDMSYGYAADTPTSSGRIPILIGPKDKYWLGRSEQNKLLIASSSISRDAFPLKIYELR